VLGVVFEGHYIGLKRFAKLLGVNAVNHQRYPFLDERVADGLCFLLQRNQAVAPGLGGIVDNILYNLIMINLCGKKRDLDVFQCTYDRRQRERDERSTKGTPQHDQRRGRLNQGRYVDTFDRGTTKDGAKAHY